MTPDLPTCPRTGRPCPSGGCLGADDPNVCRLWDSLSAIRGVPGHVLFPSPPSPPYVPDEDPPARTRRAGLDRELVVARYKEDVSWVAESPIPATVYNKGPDDLDLPPWIDVVPLANRGREGRTWLTHFTRCRDTLADLTFTAQGDPHQDPAEFLARLTLNYDDTTALTSRYLPHFPPGWIKARDLAADVTGASIRYGLAEHQGGRTLAENGRWLRLAWAHFFDVPPPDPWHYGYGAMYAIPKARILARPDAFWRWCRDVIARPEHQAEHAWGSGYAFEVLWWYLLGDAARWPVRLAQLDRGRAAASAEFCRFGSGPCGCGADARRCSHPDQPARVWRASHCLDCPFQESP